MSASAKELWGGKVGRVRPTSASGTVEVFDVGAGLGVVRTDQGERLGFHCTQIADGSRDIAVGTRVRFGLGAGRGGRWEATGLTPTGE